jgi:sporulation protein YlmC with PRC-barrel domain
MVLQGHEGAAVMAEVTPFVIGTKVSCSDGPCGEVSRVVVDPVARSVTDLVVEPDGRLGLGRLVPLDLVDATAEEVRLRCTLKEFEGLESAEDSQFVPGTQGYGAFGPEQVVSWPYYGLGGMGVSGDELAGVSQVVTYDTVPLGEVEVRRGDPVHATDGNIGRVQGLVIDSRNRHVSHVLLQEGHLWGRKEVAIPISAVTGIDEEGMKLSLTKREVQDLPAVDIDHPQP